MSEHYKAQHQEDVWMNDNWHRLGLPDHGFFCEFGAADGITYSNTYWLEKEKGWNGLLIEPDPRHKIEGRDKCWIDRGYVVGPPGRVSIGLTVDPFLTGEYRYSNHSQEAPLQVESRMEVESIPLTVILRKYQVAQVHVLSIDTEGTEIEAWRTLDRSRWNPTIVLMEFLSWGWSDRTDETIREMHKDGYDLIHTTELNGIFKSRI